MQKIDKMSQNTESDIEDDNTSYGRCYFCGSKCNNLSQICSSCKRGNICYDLTDNSVELVNSNKLEIEGETGTVIVNEKLYQGDIPEYIKTLIFTKGYDHEIEAGVLPSNLKCLNLSDCNYNFPIHKNVLPTTLTTLKLSSDFNQKIDKDILPKLQRTATKNC